MATLELERDPVSDSDEALYDGALGLADQIVVVRLRRW